MWTAESVRRLLNNPKHGLRTAIKGVWYLWLHQTADEQTSRFTKHLNGIGFSKITARAGTKLGEAINTVVKQYNNENTVPWDNVLYLYQFKGHYLKNDTIVKWIEQAKWIVNKHAGQFADIANDRYNLAA